MIRIARRLGLAVAALALFSLTGAALAGPASAETPITDPSAAAAGWLVQNYYDADCNVSPDGDRAASFFGTQCFPSPGFTIDSIFALAAAKAGGDKLAQVGTYLQSALPTYTGTDPANIYGISTGSAAKALLAFQVAGEYLEAQYLEDQAQLLDLVDNNICAAAAADCIAPGAARNIYSGISQSFVVLALARAGSDPNLDATVDFLIQSTQCADGGFSSDLPPAPCASGIDATAYALSALQAAAAAEPLAGGAAAIDDARASALAYLLSTQGADGSWAGGNVSSTALAASALSAFHDADSAAAIERALAWLIAQQSGCAAPAAAVGSLQYGDAFKSTSDALLALAGESLATLSAQGTAPAAPAQLCKSEAPATTAPPGGSTPVDPAPAGSDSSLAPAPGATVVADASSAPARPAQATPLAATGSADRALALLGAALLLCGVAALVLARRTGAHDHR